MVCLPLFITNRISLLVIKWSIHSFSPLFSLPISSSFPSSSPSHASFSCSFFIIFLIFRREIVSSSSSFSSFFRLKSSCSWCTLQISCNVPWETQFGAYPKSESIGVLSLFFTNKPIHRCLFHSEPVALSVTSYSIVTRKVAQTESNFVTRNSISLYPFSLVLCVLKKRHKYGRKKGIVPPSRRILILC